MEVVTHRLEIPQIPQLRGDRYNRDGWEVFNFVRQIFKLNGCLDAYPKLVNGDFFGFERQRDHGSKQISDTKYLMPVDGKPLLILNIEASRVSPVEFESSQDRERIRSMGYSTMTRAGSEGYSISALPNTDGIQEPESLVGAYYTHEIGSSTGSGGMTIRTSISGILLDEAEQEVGVSEHDPLSYEDRRAAFGRTMLKLVEQI